MVGHRFIGTVLIVINRHSYRTLRIPPLLLMSSAEYSYPALIHFADSEYIPVSDKDPPFLMGLTGGAVSFVRSDFLKDADRNDSRWFVR